MDNRKSGVPDSFIGVDPGPNQFGWVLCSIESCKVLKTDSATDNHEFSSLLTKHRPAYLAIEKMSSYGGSPVGASTWNTNDSIIELCMRWVVYCGTRPSLISRRQVKSSLGLAASANDAQVNARLRELWGVVGTKGGRGPLYGVKSHAWAALAVATAWHNDKKRYTCDTFTQKRSDGPMHF